MSNAIESIRQLLGRCREGRQGDRERSGVPATGEVLHHHEVHVAAGVVHGHHRPRITSPSTRSLILAPGDDFQEATALAKDMDPPLRQVVSANLGL